MPTHNLKNLIGRVFGNLTVKRRARSVRSATGRLYARWLCTCTCGQEVEVESRQLLGGHKKSCAVNGHRYPRTPAETPPVRILAASEYKAWNLMLARCYNTNIRGAKHYSARGIKVCDRWHEFENFLSDMGPKPTPKHTVEREEVNGDYAPDNCCWITKAEQTRNKRTSVYVDYNGERLLLMDLAARFGVDRNRVYQRLRLGWALDEALLTPLHEKQRVFVDYEGKQRTIASLAAEFNIAAPVLNGRLKRGWPLKRALTEQLHFRSPNRRKTK